MGKHRTRPHAAIHVKDNTKARPYLGISLGARRLGLGGRRCAESGARAAGRVQQTVALAATSIVVVIGGTTPAATATAERVIVIIVAVIAKQVGRPRQHVGRLRIVKRGAHARVIVLKLRRAAAASARPRCTARPITSVSLIAAATVAIRIDAVERGAWRRVGRPIDHGRGLKAAHFQRILALRVLLGLRWRR
jgi:hypothetical protein